MTWNCTRYIRCTEKMTKSKVKLSKVNALRYWYKTHRLLTIMKRTHRSLNTTCYPIGLPVRLEVKAHMMLDFLYEWIQSVLDYFLGKRAKVVFLGLANAGKSTLMDLLRDGKLKQHAPTSQTRSTAMKLGDVTFTVYDLGGHVQARRVWRDYFPAVDAVVFVIDAAERESFQESSQELHNISLTRLRPSLWWEETHDHPNVAGATFTQRILSDEDICEVPVLILGNKIDRAEAANQQELLDTFRLHMVLTGKDGKSRESLPSRPAELFMTSLVGKQGYGEAFRWLSKYI